MDVEGQIPGTPIPPGGLANICNPALFYPPGSWGSSNVEALKIPSTVAQGTRVALTTTDLFVPVRRSAAALSILRHESVPSRTVLGRQHNRTVLTPNGSGSIKSDVCAKTKPPVEHAPRGLLPSIIPAGGQGQSSIFNKLTRPSRWPETPKLDWYARYFRRGQFRRFLPPVCLFSPNFEGSGHQAGIYFSIPMSEQTRVQPC